MLVSSFDVLGLFSFAIGGCHGRVLLCREEVHLKGSSSSRDRRSSSSQWTKTETCSTQVGSPLVGEARAILEAMKLAKRIGLISVVFETDSSQVHQAIMSSDPSCSWEINAS
ncbi:hypothetical protein GH714_019481 [Hevea brasiliensis]|uniref:RNase H type-1 domain-containing protein n=1 Tax=Hevea brasiliensis TaxID=3981 RepID=A0A6A6LZV4_HEVBR|nr:hypothetical protein GH714_019481 [Hevea brasiliensis]